MSKHQENLAERVKRAHDEHNAKLTKALGDREELLAACKEVEKWLRENVKAVNRPASLDKMLLDAIANAGRRRPFRRSTPEGK